jgi:hypothetical protein
MRKLVKNEIREYDGKHTIVSQCETTDTEGRTIKLFRIYKANYLNSDVDVTDATKEIINKISRKATHD